MIRPFLSCFAAVLSHIMTFFVVMVVVLAVNVDHKEHASVFLESLLRQVVPLIIPADFSAETLHATWDPRANSIQIRLDHMTVIGHDVPVYADVRRVILDMSYGFHYPRRFMVDRLVLDGPQGHLTVDAPQEDQGAFSPPSIPLGGLPLQQMIIRQGSLVIKTPTHEKRLDDVSATYQVISPTDSDLTLQGTFRQGQATVPFGVQGRGTLKHQMLETLSLSMTTDQAVVPAPSDTSAAPLTLRAQGEVMLNLKHKKATVTQPIILSMGESTLTLTAEATPQAVDVRARLQNLPIAHLGPLWPDELAAGGKAWVVSHIPEGMVPDATLAVSLKANATKAFDVHTLSATVALNGAKIAYLPQMTPITGVQAALRFDLSGMTGTITKAMMGTTPLSKGSVAITGFDKDLQTILIKAQLTGPLKDQVSEIMRAIPKDFANAGLNQDTFGGDAVTALSVGFPLIDELAFSDVTLSATSQIKRFIMAHADLPLPVRDGNLKVTFKNNVLEVRGQVLAKTVPADVVFQGDFRGEKAKTGITVDAVVPASEVVPYLPSMAMVTGAGRLRLEQPMGKQESIITLDAQDMGVSLTVPTFVKPKGVLLTATLKGTPAQRIFDVQGEKGAKAMGTLQTTPDGITRVRVDAFTLGSNDIRAVITDTQGHLNIDASAAVVDLKHFGTGHPEGFTPPQEPVDVFDLPELTVRAQSQMVHLVDHDLLNMALDTHMHNDALERLSLSGRSKTGKPFAITLNPEGTSVAVTSEDTAFLTEALGLQSRLQGGTLKGTIAPLNQGRLSPKTKIHLEMNQVTLKRAPIFSRILSLASLSGPLELLTGQGMLMHTIVLDARLGKETFFIDNLEMKNASLGVFFTGQMGLNDDSIGGKGALVPAYALSRIVSFIPLVGSLLTNEDKGIISISFGLSGNMDDPSVTVNPLTSVTPGALQDLFGMGRRKTDGGEVEDAGDRTDEPASKEKQP